MNRSLDILQGFFFNSIRKILNGMGQLVTVSPFVVIFLLVLVLGALAFILLKYRTLQERF